MATLTPAQRRWRTRNEPALRVAAPVLDLDLAAGDRLSRAVQRDDLQRVPPRAALSPTETRVRTHRPTEMRVSTHRPTEMRRP